MFTANKKQTKKLILVQNALLNRGSIGACTPFWKRSPPFLEFLSEPSLDSKIESEKSISPDISLKEHPRMNFENPHEQYNNLFVRK